VCGFEGRQRIRTNSGKKIISVTKSVMKICGNLTKMSIGVCASVCYTVTIYILCLCRSRNELCTLKIP
jgi:hypothetical protein